jgi:hypothetical protein
MSAHRGEGQTFHSIVPDLIAETIERRPGDHDLH